MDALYERGDGVCRAAAVVGTDEGVEEAAHVVCVEALLSSLLRECSSLPLGLNTGRRTPVSGKSKNSGRTRFCLSDSLRRSPAFISAGWARRVNDIPAQREVKSYMVYMPIIRRLWSRILSRSIISPAFLIRSASAFNRSFSWTLSGSGNSSVISWDLLLLLLLPERRNRRANHALGRKMLHSVRAGSPRAPGSALCTGPRGEASPPSCASCSAFGAPGGLLSVNRERVVDVDAVDGAGDAGIEAVEAHS